MVTLLVLICCLCSVSLPHSAFDGSVIVAFPKTHYNFWTKLIVSPMLWGVDPGFFNGEFIFTKGVGKGVRFVNFT